MSQVKALRKVIEGTEISFPYAIGDSKCVYCKGETSIFPTKFEVHLKNGFVIKPVCTVCLNEIFLEHPFEINFIKKIGEE